jgi:hypothetical protein
MGERRYNSGHATSLHHAHCRTQCGHLSGKVVVPTGAHISRLVAARFQLDLLQHTMLLIARTDAESARLLSSTVDARDHPYIRGAPTRLPDGSRRPALAEVLDRAEADGRSAVEIDNLEAKWLSEVKLTTFDEGKAHHSFILRWGCCLVLLALTGFFVHRTQLSSKRFRGRATFPPTRRRLLSSAIGRRLLESRTLRHGILLQTLSVPKLTGTGIVRHALLNFFFSYSRQLRKQCRVPARDTTILLVELMLRCQEHWHLRPVLI